MNTTDVRNDPVLATLSTLRSCDVGRSRDERLRRHCHAALRPPSTPLVGRVTVEGSRWRSVVGPVIAGTWCAVYVFETIRRVAAFYSP